MCTRTTLSTVLPCWPQQHKSLRHVLATATQVPGARAGHFNQKVRYRHLVDTLSSYTASYANLLHDYYLGQEVEGDPREKQISEVFHDAKGSIDHPVCQPLCVIILFFRVNGLAAAGRVNLLSNNPPKQ